MASPMALSASIENIVGSGTSAVEGSWVIVTLKLSKPDVVEYPYKVELLAVL